MGNNIALEMKNIKKSFYGTVVLSDISFTLNEGEVLGLVGENGAGKSTLMKILFGEEDIFSTGGYEGEVFVNGKRVDIKSAYDALSLGIGMVHQEFSLIPGFTATENILLNREVTKDSFVTNVFGDRVKTLDRKKMKEIAKNAISNIGLSIDDEMKVSTMPVGYKQFIEIAREISKENLKVLILDEPTAVLTENEAEVLLDAIKKLAKKGISIVFISHRLQEIFNVCNKVIVIRDGLKVLDKDVTSTNVNEITKAMVGRDIDKDKVEYERGNNNGDVIMSIKDLFVDMPGENVKGLNLDIKEGEILGIGGIAGQGKLGIPNGIMGLYDAVGKITFCGEELDLNNPKACLDKGIAFVSEDRRGVGLLLDESLEWNISFTAMQAQNNFLKKLLGGLIKLRDEKSIYNITEHYIEKLNIKCQGTKQKARELSGGNQQKVCLAKAFAFKPKFLFVSEPTRGIDVGAKALVLHALYQYRKDKNITIVMISSELEELRQICDRIAIVSNGKIAGILSSTSRQEEFAKLMVGVD